MQNEPNPTTADKDTIVKLRRGDLEARIAPFGAGMRGVTRLVNGERQPVITGYASTSEQSGGQGDVLIPFPGRIRAGRYSFEGHDYQLDCNDKEGPNAIHGFLRKRFWTVVSQSDHAVVLSTEISADEFAAKGYPFSLRAQVMYSLDDGGGFECAMQLENIGTQTAPVAAGFHPYFTVGSDVIDQDRLTLPFASYLEYDGLLPTGNVLPVEGTGNDFRHGRMIDATVFNTCFCDSLRDPDGRLRIHLANALGTRSLTVWLDEIFDYVVLYSGDPLPDSHRRRALAIEPMTCGSDAFNHPEWGLVSLPPQGFLRGSWGVEGIRVHNGTSAS